MLEPENLWLIKLLRLLRTLWKSSNKPEGSSKVVSVGANCYELASGHDVVYGSCSQAAEKFSVGYFIRFNVYINNGVINALRIESVLLS